MKNVKQIFANKRIKLYLAAETCLLLGMKLGGYLHLTWRQIDILQYMAVLLNAAAAFFCFLRYGHSSSHASAKLIACGLFITAAADVFLTLIGTDRAFVIGTALFCVVQMLYALYLRPGKGILSALIILFAAGLFILNGAGKLSVLAVLGLFDISILLMNVLTAWKGGKAKADVLFRAGLTLFLFCDISVGLRMAADGKLYDAAAFLTWILYVPAQVCITLSYIMKTQRFCVMLPFKGSGMEVL